MKLIVATRNPGKLIEIRQLLAGIDVEVVGVDELGGMPDEIDEDADTFAGNAAKKARVIAAAAWLPTLADDSGLEVDALGGAPGVRSARFAGIPCSDAANNQKLLLLLRDVPPARRTARFRCAVALADPHGPLGDEIVGAEGSCQGTILADPRGSGGFGYDPLFYSPELGRTFAEAGVGPKSGISHRARALAAIRPRLVDYLLARARAPR
jgi:XTP/dITP diphosphohydrolase